MEAVLADTPRRVLEAGDIVAGGSAVMAMATAVGTVAAMPVGTVAAMPADTVVVTATAVMAAVMDTTAADGMAAGVVGAGAAWASTIPGGAVLITDTIRTTVTDTGIRLTDMATAMAVTTRLRIIIRRSESA